MGPPEAQIGTVSLEAAAMGHTKVAVQTDQALSLAKFCQFVFG